MLPFADEKGWPRQNVMLELEFKKMSDISSL